jgi:hypothetical protein
MIDLTRVLEVGLSAAEKWEGASGREAETWAEIATGALCVLNIELSRGGRLPAMWAGARQPLAGG